MNIKYILNYINTQWTIIHYYYEQYYVQHTYYIKCIYDNSNGMIRFVMVDSYAVNAIE